MHKLKLKFLILSKNLKKYGTLQNDFFFLFVKKYQLICDLSKKGQLNSSFSIFEYLEYILVFAVLKTATLSLYPII